MSRILPVAQSPHMGRRGGILSYPVRRCTITYAVWHRVIVCCLAPEDGQGSGSARQWENSRPLYGIRPKASKGLNRLRRVLQNPHSWVPCPAAKRSGKSHRRLLIEAISRQLSAFSHLLWLMADLLLRARRGL